MSFKFTTPKGEKVYDNHGCAWRTDYEINFKVDNIDFTARYADTFRNIDLLHENELITDKIYRNGSVYDMDSIYQVIQEAFNEDEIVKEAFYKLKGNTLEGLKENFCKNLLNECDYE